MGTHDRRTLLKVGFFGATAALLAACGESIRSTPLAAGGLAVAAVKPPAANADSGDHDHVADTPAHDHPAEATVAELVLPGAATGVAGADDSGAAARADVSHAEDGDAHIEAAVHAESEDEHSAAATVELTVVSTEFKFAPAELEVAAGERVRLTDTNRGVMFHDLVVHDMPATDVHSEGGAEHPHGAQASGPHADAMGGVHLNVNPGQTAAVEFTPTTPGRYDFTCTVPGHAAAGMQGVLIVSAS